MLDGNVMAKFRERLLKEKRELLGLEEKGRDAAKPVELDQARLGRLSRMDALQGQAMFMEVKRRRQRELRKVSAALGRMEDGYYGYCLKCDEDISVKRLELDPAAPLCINCASEAERI